MKNELVAPPRWAEAILRSLLRPGDRESTSGDLLEEYRAVRYPAHGRLRADAWYIKHVWSVFLHFMWPMMLAAALVGLLQVIQNRGYRLVPFPGILIFHGALYLGVGFRASRRTGLIRTAIIAGAVSSLLVFAITATGIMGVGFPLFKGLLSKHFLFVRIRILAVGILMFLSLGIVFGTIGGMIGWWIGPHRPKEVRTS